MMSRWSVRLSGGGSVSVRVTSRSGRWRRGSWRDDRVDGASHGRSLAQAFSLRTPSARVPAAHLMARPRPGGTPVERGIALHSQMRGAGEVLDASGIAASAKPCQASHRESGFRQVRHTAGTAHSLAADRWGSPPSPCHSWSSGQSGGWSPGPQVPVRVVGRPPGNSVLRTQQAAAQPGRPADLRSLDGLEPHQGCPLVDDDGIEGGLCLRCCLGCGGRSLLRSLGLCGGRDLFGSQRPQPIECSSTAIDEVLHGPHGIGVLVCRRAVSASRIAAMSPRGPPPRM